MNILEHDVDQSTTIENTMASHLELGGPFHKRHKSVLSNYNTRNMNSKSTLDQRSGSQLMRPIASKKVLDYSCGDPYYNIKQEQRGDYQRVHGLDRAINETMQNLKLYPRLRQNIVNKLGNFAANRETENAQKGFDGAKRSRMLIR